MCRPAEKNTNVFHFLRNSTSKDGWRMQLYVKFLVCFRNLKQSSCLIWKSHIFTQPEDIKFPFFKAFIDMQFNQRTFHNFYSKPVLSEMHISIYFAIQESFLFHRKLLCRLRELASRASNSHLIKIIILNSFGNYFKLNPGAFSRKARQIIAEWNKLKFAASFKLTHQKNAAEQRNLSANNHLHSLCLMNKLNALYFFGVQNICI